MGCNHASGSADPVRVQSISSCSKACKDSDISFHDGAHRPGTFLSTVAFCLSHFILTPKIRKFVFLLLRKELNTATSKFSISMLTTAYIHVLHLLYAKNHIYIQDKLQWCAMTFARDVTIAELDAILRKGVIVNQKPFWLTPFTHEFNSTTDCIIPSFPFMGGKENHFHCPLVARSKHAWCPTRSSCWWAPKAHYRAPSLPHQHLPYSPLVSVALVSQRGKMIPNLQRSTPIPQDILVLGSSGCWPSSPPARQWEAAHSQQGFTPTSYMKSNGFALAKLVCEDFNQSISLLIPEYLI